MSTENIVKNKYYRILKDKTNSIWDRISFWTHADDVELTGGTTLSSDLTAKQTKIDATQSDFAQVETSPSTHAYTKGQMLIYNNQLYRVKAAIAVGNTLTVGTNIEVVSVSTLSSMLTATSGNQFYFDYKDNKPGFYPTASKTASQFVPFGGTTPEFISFGGNRTQSEVTLSTNGHTEGYLICASTTYDINTWQDINTISGCDKVEIYRNAMTPAYAANSTSIQVFKITNAGSTISFKPPYVLGCGVFMVL